MAYQLSILLMLALAWPSTWAFTATNEASNTNEVLGVYIEHPPESAVAPKGDEVVFECELNLKPDRLEWRFRHTSVISSSSSAGGYRYLRGYNVTNSNEERIWKLRMYVSAETLGDYQCVAWYGSGAIASTPARLTLVSISIDNANGYSRNAVRWSVAPRNCILVRCGTVSSNPPAIWSFYRNGEKLPQSEVLPGPAGALVLNSVTATDSGNYTCTATNAITGVELRLPQSIDVRVDYTDRTPPYFLVQQPPTQVDARPGETIVLECPGVGSPQPKPVWSSPNVPNIDNNRTKVLAYGLQIVDVRAEDQGSYVCRLDNGIAPVLVHMIKLSVLERPRILRGPASTLTTEGQPLELECSVTGNPQPEIYWLINGADAAADNETLHEDRRLLIHHVQKRHAGIVQCFAKNVVGEISEGNLLLVNPLDISGEDYLPLGNVPMRPAHEHANNYGGGRNKGRRKNMRVPSMVPPSRPNVSRLSDDSVMLRWSVSRNDGLAIQFFKVQYRMLGDNARKIPRENWQTTNENIPYGKRDRDHGHGHSLGSKNFTSSVTGLRPERYYRFRVMAVYSNNDNKAGNTSLKFYLQRGSAKSNLPVPELRDVESISESAVLLHWALPTTAAAPTSPMPQIEGYYAYYRPAASAGEYLKATVDGSQLRKYKIDMLEPGTAYEFKLQTFNAHAASEFSVIRQGHTKKSTGHGTGVPAFVPTSKANREQNSIYPVIAGAAGGGILLLIASIVACLCVQRRRRKNAQPDDENKPQLDHIQADFVTSAVLGVAPHHKSGDVRRLNGVMPRMNITANPLAQDTAAAAAAAAAAADKNRNVMEMRFMPPPNSVANNNNSSSSSSNEQQPSSEQSNADAVAAAAATAAASVEAEANADGRLSNGLAFGIGIGASSSCETLEACESIRQEEQPPSLPSLPPLPPLPKKSSSNGTQLQEQLNSNAAAVVVAAANAALHQSGLHHAQPYHPPPTPTACTPTMLHKRPHEQQQHQSAYYQQQVGNVSASPMLDQQRRTLERSVRSLQHHQQHQQQQHTPPPGTATHGGSYGMEEGFLTTPVRIPSLRRQRRASGSQHNSHSNLNLNLSHNNNVNNVSNNNHLAQHHLPHQLQQTHQTHQALPHMHHPHGHHSHAHHPHHLMGIPIVPGSPRVQRSPMPARALIKRTRLGSHTDNISSGSLNSIEV